MQAIGSLKKAAASPALATPAVCADEQSAAYIASRVRLSFPAPVAPPPLLRMLHDQPLQHGIVSARIALDLAVVVWAGQPGQRCFIAHHVASVGIAPSPRRDHRRP